jgi:DNA replicative helicase MCM subunit Mcm2 (Cdc46/Mcm family)
MAGRTDQPVTEEEQDDDPLIPQRLLTKYIMYARANISPQLHDIDQDKISKLYSELRRESKNLGGVSLPVGSSTSMREFTDLPLRGLARCRSPFGTSSP